jgi:hypothetical protein
MRFGVSRSPQLGRDCPVHAAYSLYVEAFRA